MLGVRLASRRGSPCVCAWWCVGVRLSSRLPSSSTRHASSLLAPNLLFTRRVVAEGFRRSLIWGGIENRRYFRGRGLRRVRPRQSPEHAMPTGPRAAGICASRKHLCSENFRDGPWSGHTQNTIWAHTQGTLRAPTQGTHRHTVLRCSIDVPG